MRQQHDLVQGSDAWHQFRLEHFGASEAASMLGLSKHVKRSELLRMKHTGIAKEFSDWVQENVLDNGHAIEASARPMAEAIICDELYPATYSDGKLSASCDGLTMDGATAFEHKQWNAELAATVQSGVLPDEYQPQCQQVMMVTGASRALFMVSDGTPDNCVHLWVTPVVEWRKKIMQGWAQFADDLASYQHVEEAPVVIGHAPESLPSLRIEVTGMVTASNLDEFKRHALSVIGAIKTDLQTDEDFASAEKTVKWCGEVEERLDAAKQHALSQTASIDDLFRAIDQIKAEARAKRLELDKLVKSRKEAIRIEIMRAAQAALQAHTETLNQRLGKPYLPAQDMTRFGSAIKGLKSIASLRDAVNTELANAKIEASGIADKIEINLNTLRELARDHAFLFHDTAQIVLKANDDLTALVKARIADYKTAEEIRLKAERERIRKEEQANAATPPPIAVPAAPAAVAPIARNDAPVTPIAQKAPEVNLIDAYMATISVGPNQKQLIRKHLAAFVEFCSHSPEVQEMADAKIDLEAYRQ